MEGWHTHTMDKDLKRQLDTIQAALADITNRLRRLEGTDRENISRAEAAARMGISVRTLERWIKDGTIKATQAKPGGRVTIPMSEVKRVLGHK